MLRYLCNTQEILSSVIHSISRKVVLFMADGKELKPKSFRIDDETAEKFKEIASSIGGSQQETLAKLIEAFEFQQGKAVLTEKKADIEQFEKYVGCLVHMFMGALEDNQNITETVRTEFDALLKSKDSIIQDLQEKLTVAKQLKEEATTRAKAHANENENLKQAIERLNAEYNSKMDDMQDMLKDKDNLNKALTSSCNDLKAKVEQMATEEEQNKEFRQELNNLKKEYDKLETTYKSLQADFSHEKTKYEQNITQMQKHENEALERIKEQEQIKLEKAVLELEKKYQEQIQKLKEEKQIEIDKYQQKYFELLEQKEQTKAKRTNKTTNKQEP